MQLELLSCWQLRWSENVCHYDSLDVTHLFLTSSLGVTKDIFATLNKNLLLWAKTQTLTYLLNAFWGGVRLPPHEFELKSTKISQCKDRKGNRRKLTCLLLSRDPMSGVLMSSYMISLLFFIPAILIIRMLFNEHNI